MENNINGGAHGVCGVVFCNIAKLLVN